MADITLNVQAYCKVILHAAKYPHAGVCGVLLAEESKVKESKSLKFVDCVPLFHISLGLAPMLEAALLQIEGYCKTKGLVIGGYYQANPNYDDQTLNHSAKTVGRKLSDHIPEACVFMIDNRRIFPESVSEAYKVYLFKDNNFKESDKRETVEEETIQKASDLLRAEAYRKLIDFDNHLDDLSNDWRNVEINQLISQCV
ncbi:hypothetical protein SNE40_017989 [Patella caerulea]|uniref:MPN domain-containing protein n=1 Tax=Patella caerulea TaxID=87958 RepID=A0AAN8PND8_PATCE